MTTKHEEVRPLLLKEYPSREGYFITHTNYPGLILSLDPMSKQLIYKGAYIDGKIVKVLSHAEKEFLSGNGVGLTGF